MQKKVATYSVAANTCSKTLQAIVETHSYLMVTVGYITQMRAEIKTI
jgi:hypothetical protein